MSSTLMNNQKPRYNNQTITKHQDTITKFVTIHGENLIFVTASEAKQSETFKNLRLLRPKGLAMT